MCTTLSLTSNSFHSFAVGGCCVFLLRLSVGHSEPHRLRCREYKPDDLIVRFDFGGLQINGPVVIKFFDLSPRRGGADAWPQMFTAVFELGQITEDLLRFTRSHIHCAQADREYVARLLFFGCVAIRFLWFLVERCIVILTLTSKFDPDFFVDFIFQPK